MRIWAEKNFASTRTRVRGKGIEIALSSLPLEAQRDYYARFAARMTAGAVMPATPNVAVATPDVAPSCCLPAPGGEPIQAGACPLPAHTSPAATGAGGLAGGGGAGGAFVAGGSTAVPQGYPMAPATTVVEGAGNGPLTRGAGSIPAAPATTRATFKDSLQAASDDDLSDAILVGRLVGARRPTEADFERVRRAREIMIALRPLLDLPERHRGRRALAEQIGKALGCGWQHVYRLADKAREGGVIALARMGMRADRGQARVVVSAPWLVWAEAAAGVIGLDVPQLAERMVQAVRAAWVGGAPSARQAWLTATAAVGRVLHEMGAPSDLVAQLLSLPCPRRFVEAEGQQFRVAGRSLRDAKGVYDRNLTPVKRTAAGLMPGDLVCGDISPLDIPVARPDGSTAYARMISWHDVATNWLWIDLFLCEKGEGVRREHVAASFCRMCELAPFGAPKRLYLDNGSEYKWEELLFAWAQLAELTGQRFRADEAALLPESARVVRSIPFHPRGKRIEGQFGNLGRWLGWWLGYVGGNRMAKKVASLGKAPVVSDYEAVRQWLAATLADYHATPQGGEAMGGLSPQQKIDRALDAGWKPMRIDRVALMLAFADREVRTVNRGAIQYRGMTWTADFLMGIEGRVEVAYPRIAAPEFEALLVIHKGEVLGAAAPERVFGILDEAGAKEAGRRRQALRLLMAEKMEQAGGALDQAQVAGFRAQMLGLQATLDRASEAAEVVEATGELADMAAAYARARAELSEQARALMARAKAAKEAEALTRLAFEDEETRAARALGF